MAGLAHGLVLGQPWPERLRHAAALGTAAVAAPAAGQFAAGGLPTGRWPGPGHRAGRSADARRGMAEIVGPAAAAGRGVGAFNVIGIEHAEAIVAGAEAAGAPVVLQISENCVRLPRGARADRRAALAAAAAAAVPVAVHLDHATGEDLVRDAVTWASARSCSTRPRLPYADNVRATARRRRPGATTAGVWVEAELGEIGGKDGVHDPGARTQPGEAAAYRRRDRRRRAGRGRRQLARDAHQGRGARSRT